MLRSKLGLLGLCALALGLMAFVTSSASAAPEWLILNSKAEVKTAKELPATITGEFDLLEKENAKKEIEFTKTDGTLLSKLSNIALSVLCTAFTFTGGELVGEGKLKEGGKVTFTGCTVPVPTGNICTVKSKGAPAVGTVESKEGKGHLDKSGETEIEPKTGTVFAELVFEGKECTLPEGAQSVNGVLWITDSEAATHLEKHLITESKAHYGKDSKGVARLGTLWIGADSEEHLETYLDGSAKVFLSGPHAGLKWGAVFP